MGSKAGVSLVIVPRERATAAVDSLESIYGNTRTPFELIYVDCMLYGQHRRRVREMVETRGDRYVRHEGFLYPNQARNLGARLARGKYLVFVDNDIFVEPGWLASLTKCAEDTGAGVVGPVYLEGEPNDPLVHCAGGSIEFVADDGGTRSIIVCQHELSTPLANLPELQRGPTGLVEFHTVLVTRECLDAIGGEFDASLETTREHVDLCLSARDAGFEIYLEADSRVCYRHTKPLHVLDLRYFLFRWSKSATESTIEHFERKWQAKLDVRRRTIIKDRRRRAVITAVGQNGVIRRIGGEPVRRLVNRLCALPDPRSLIPLRKPS